MPKPFRASRPPREALTLALGGALFLGALWLLRRQLSEHTLADVLRAAESVPPAHVLLAGAFTVLSFVVLSGYDRLGLSYVGRPLPYRRVALASFLGYGVSNALGFPLLTGTPVRYRLYTGWGLEGEEVLRLTAFSTTTFWVGFCATAGCALLFDPYTVLGVSLLTAGALRSVGVLLLAATASWVVLASRRREPLRMGPLTLPVPSSGLVWRQVLLGAADWTAAAAVLFVLLPEGHGLSFPAWVGVFAAAQVLGLLSHVPGGIGVFEAVIVALVPESVPEAHVLASLLTYRAVYYLLPLLAAALALGVHEARARSAALGRVRQVAEAGFSALAPMALAAVVFLMGALLLAGGSVPLAPERANRLVRVLTLPGLELSHFLSSVVGSALLVVAMGLRLRLRTAYVLTLLLLLAATALSVARGDGPLAAALPLAALVAVLPARAEFYRRSALLREPLSWEWIFAMALVVVTVAWLGLFAYRNVAFSSEMWWQFALRGDAPRWLREMVGAAGVLLVFGGSRLLRPAPPPLPSLDAPVEPSREVVDVVASSPRANAHLALLGDKALLLAPGSEAFIMYGVEGRSWVAMGDPVGDEDAFDGLARRFRQEAHRHGGWAVFYQVRPEHLVLYLDLGLTLTKLGEEARVPLEGFTLEGRQRGDFRTAVRRAEREDTTLEIVAGEDAPPLLPELRRISDAWLQGKSTREKGFSLGSFRDDYLTRTRLALVRKEGRPVAFSNLWAPARAREEMSLDLMRYDPEAAPRGVMDFLFAKVMLWASAEGYRWFSLGMAPLAGLESGALAPLWSRLGAAVFRHGEHFYNFQGLRAYKEKFGPAWEPRYLASPGGLVVPRALANVSTLVSGGVAGVLSR